MWPKIYELLRIKYSLACADNYLWYIGPIPTGNGQLEHGSLFIFHLERLLNRKNSWTTCVATTCLKANRSATANRLPWTHFNLHTRHALRMGQPITEKSYNFVRHCRQGSRMNVHGKVSARLEPFAFVWEHLFPPYHSLSWPLYQKMAVTRNSGRA